MKLLAGNSLLRPPLLLISQPRSLTAKVLMENLEVHQGHIPVNGSSLEKSGQ